MDLGAEGTTGFVVDEVGTVTAALAVTGAVAALATAGAGGAEEAVVVAAGGGGGGADIDAGNAAGGGAGACVGAGAGAGGAAVVVAVDAGGAGAAGAAGGAGGAVDGVADGTDCAGLAAATEAGLGLASRTGALQTCDPPKAGIDAGGDEARGAYRSLDASARLASMASSLPGSRRGSLVDRGSTAMDVRRGYVSA